MVSPWAPARSTDAPFVEDACDSRPLRVLEALGTAGSEVGSAILGGRRTDDTDGRLGFDVVGGDGTGPSSAERRCAVFAAGEPA
jgi:hypothetical protein